MAHYENLGEMRAEVQSRLQKDTFFEAADIDRYLNNGQLALVRDARILTGFDTSVLSVTGQQEYAIPDTALYLEEVLFDKLPLLHVSLREALRMQAILVDPSSLRATPMYFYERKDTQTFGTWPITGDTGKTFLLFFLKRPTILVADVDTPDIPRQYREGPILWALWKLHETDRESEVADRFHRMYKDHVDMARLQVRGDQAHYVDEPKDSIVWS